MASFIIEGGHRLKGEIVPQGAKNEALQVLCAVLLTNEPVRIKNIPNIVDVKNQIKLLEDMGVEIGHEVLITKCGEIIPGILKDLTTGISREGYVFE